MILVAGNLLLSDTERVLVGLQLIARTGAQQ